MSDEQPGPQVTEAIDRLKRVACGWDPSQHTSDLITLCESLAAKDTHISTLLQQRSADEQQAKWDRETIARLRDALREAITGYEQCLEWQKPLCVELQQKHIATLRAELATEGKQP